jgi:hypothetical protein
MLKYYNIIKLVATLLSKILKIKNVAVSIYWKWQGTKYAKNVPDKNQHY